MPFSSARQWLGLGKEVTRGTAVAATYFLPAKSPQWTPDITMLDDTGLRGSMVDIYDQVAGLRHDQMDWTMDVYADTFPALLRAVLGSTDTVTGAGPYVHVIGLLNTGDGQPPSYTIAYFDANEEWQLPAGQGDELSLKFNATGLLEATCKFLSNPATLSGADTPTFSAVEAAPSWDCVVTLGGTPITKTMDGEVSLKRGTKPIEAITGTQSPYRIWAGPLQTSGKLTLVYESDTEFDYFLNNSKGEALDLKWTDPAANTIEYHLSTPGFKTGKKTAGKEWIEVELEFVGLPNSTDAVAGGLSPIKTTTTNGVSAAF